MSAVGDPLKEADAQVLMVDAAALLAVGSLLRVYRYVAQLAQLVALCTRQGI